MRLLILGLILLALTSCEDEISPDLGLIKWRLMLSDERLHVAILLVDYQSNEFLCGQLSHYEMYDSCDSTGIPLEFDYSSPSWGSGDLTVTYTPAGDTVFHGRLPATGLDRISHPATFLGPGEFVLEEEAESFPSLAVFKGPGPVDVEYIARAEAAWEAVEQLDIVRAYGERRYTAGFYIYPSQYIDVRPTRGQWLIFLCRGTVPD